MLELEKTIIPIVNIGNKFTFEELKNDLISNLIPEIHFSKNISKNILIIEVLNKLEPKTKSQIRNKLLNNN